VGDNQPHQKRNEDDPPKREAVGDIHLRSSRRPFALSGAAGPPIPEFSRFGGRA
jgi:hypothetical protein